MSKYKKFYLIGGNDVAIAADQPAGYIFIDSEPPSNEYIASPNGEWIINPQEAQLKMIAELDWIDVQLKYNASNDELRSQFTNEQLYSYAIACRDYVRHIDNVLTIVGDKPERPQ